jgi:hypothetical protein
VALLGKTIPAASSFLRMSLVMRLLAMRL